VRNPIPAVHNWDNASRPLCNFHKSRLGHVKVDSGWIAPATSIWVLGPIWRTKVRCSHRGEWDPSIAPFWLVTLYLVASPASVTIVKQCWAQGRCICSITINKQISISTSSSCKPNTEKGSSIEVFCIFFKDEIYFLLLNKIVDGWNLFECKLL
jgi:hypothetical protein